jgi:chromosome segregation ATPase
MLSYQAETKRSKQDLELLQAKFDVANTMNEQYRNRITELEHTISEEKLKLAEVTLKTAHLQKELNDKDERIRMLGAKQTRRTK